MSSTSPAPVKGARLALIIGGIASVAFGVAILLWPTKAALAITILVAIYAIIAGVIYVGTGLASKGLGAGGRIGHVVLGLLYIVAGGLAFTQLQATAAFLAVFVTIMVGVLWIFEGLVSLFTLGASNSKFFTIVFAAISIIAGLTLVTSPLWGAVFLWWFLGVSLIVLGILNALRSIFGRKG